MAVVVWLSGTPSLDVWEMLVHIQVWDRALCLGTSRGWGDTVQSFSDPEFLEEAKRMEDNSNSLCPKVSVMDEEVTELSMGWKGSLIIEVLDKRIGFLALKN